MSKRLLAVLVVVAVTAASFAIFVGVTAVKRPPTLARDLHEAPSATQLNDAGGVQVKVSVDPKADMTDGSVSFNITLDTHSVDLQQFDLRKLSRVTLEPGGELTDLAWQPKGEGGGHHVEGTLTARADASKLVSARAIRLEMPGAASPEARRFEWKVDGI